MSDVVVLKIEEYNVELIKKKLNEGLKLIGGIESIIPKDKNVLLKPNLLMGSTVDEAVTTHPAVFEAVIQIMLDHHYSIGYGDSPGFGDPKKVANKAGLKNIADIYQIPLADFTNGYTAHFENGNVCKQFQIVNAFKEYEAVLNLPKMKAHALQRITGAIKNSFGLVHGFHKGMMHGRYSNAYNFAQMLIDMNNYLKVDLHIMDGIIAMEGNGPKNGHPTPMNVILISTDPVALDTVFCKLIDLDPTIIPTIQYGHESGLGSLKDITLLGDSIETLINPNFDIDRTPLRLTENSKLKFLRQHVLRRPYIIEDNCKKCGLCVEVCPVEGKAINFVNDDKSNPPKYNYNDCIRCYCCQEMCPYSAIEIKKPLLGKLLYGLKILK